MIFATLMVAMTLSANNMIRYKYQQVGNVKVFYREAGDPQKPTILLLHGFPSSSVQFRELIPELMDDYHLIAPAMPISDRPKLP